MGQHYLSVNVTGVLIQITIISAVFPLFVLENPSEAWK